MKIPSRLVYVAGYLFAQGFHRWELDLRSQTLEEDQLQTCLRQDIDGMKVQQMALNSERICAKSWTIADVGHRVEALVSDAQPGDVNAIGRNEFIVTREVDGRNGVLVAVSATAARIGEDVERMSQQRARLRYLSVGNETANLAAGNVMSAQGELGIDNGLEAHLLAQRVEGIHISLRFVPEMEVVALVNFARVQRSREHLAREVGRPHQRKVTGERQYQHGFYASLFQ